MEYQDEEQLKQKIGIDSWRNLSKEKFLTFVSELPNMSEEVALKVVEQFPDFKSLVLGSLDDVQKEAANLVGVNWKSQKKVHEAFAHYREILSKELDRDNLTSEDRFRILEMLKKALDDEALKDREHKAFALKVLGVVASAAAIAVAASVAVLGGKAKIDL
ncbi:hypothetical protein ACFUTX_12140 [Microbacterium sp. NPDC057407]|uniref:hypothetical protein n=1 Tax=Microbacterium sp. NPDC057407 TaxID=3346120 RepID=UPI003672A669